MKLSHEEVSAHVNHYLTEFSIYVPIDKIAEVARVLWEALDNDTTIWTIGNGGSYFTAAHAALDLAKWPSRNGRRPYGPRAAFLGDMGAVTAWANDTDFKSVWFHLAQLHVNPGDVVLAFTCSGRSENVIAGLRGSRARGAVNIVLTGADPGTPVELYADHLIKVRRSDIRQVEDVHLAIAHALAGVLRANDPDEGDE